MELQHVCQISLDDIVVAAQRDGLGKIAVLMMMNVQLVVVHLVTMVAHVLTHLDHSYVSVNQVTQVIIIQRNPAITKCHGTDKNVRYSGVFVIAKTPL